MGYGIVQDQELLNTLAAEFARERRSDHRNTAAAFVDRYADRIYENGLEPSAKELKICYGVMLRKYEDAHG